MHDLRDDPDAHALDRRDPTWYAASDTATVRVMAAGDLRTVRAPDLRIPGARPLSDYGLRIDACPVEVQIDAQARDLRAAGDKIAELTAQVGTLQAVCSELSRRVTALEGRG